MTTAPCPASGCGRELPIDPSLGYDTYTCPCDRRCLLDVGLTKTKQYVLREHKASQGERHEINLIAHALVTGQALSQAQPTRRLAYSEADPASDHMARAHLSAFNLYRETAKLLSLGHYQRALETADRARAAERAYDLHARNYAKASPEEIHEAVWHDADRYFIELHDAQVIKKPKDKDGPYTALKLTRLEFPFLALWDEENSTWDVANGPMLELISGLEVGEDGWRDLMGLLVYLRGEEVNGEKSGKPGRKADALHLIYRENEGHLKPLPVTKRFPRALLALEALRRSLNINPQRIQRDTPVPEWVKQDDWLPDWAEDQLDDGKPQRRRPRNNR